jgi:DNA recombination protein RmuC
VEAPFLIGAVACGFVLVAVLLVMVLFRLGTLAHAAVDRTEVKAQLLALGNQNERLERELRVQMIQARTESTHNAQAARSELGVTLGQFSQALQNQLASMARVQNESLSTLTQSNEQRLEAVRATVEQRLELLRTDNASKLEQMRTTVDESLHATLDKRLGESFKLVSDRLEQVHKGLGEMQTLALGVGDLKRVLTNVKTRGTWGEVQLGILLAEVLTPQQFETNVETVPGSGKRVEFAIRLPGRGDDGKPCWLPVDAKFPLDDWQRLQDALERADAGAADVSRKALADFLKLQAKTIRDAYVSPPFTTDFAILFVPTEGLYAEMMSRPGFAELLQRDYRVTLTGPTNFLALLNSLQMGFRTLAIEQRSSEVWKVLAAVKTDFMRFGEILGRTQKKLQEASNTIEEARGRSTTIARKLRDVEELPEVDADKLLANEPRLVYDADADAAPGSGVHVDPPRSRDGS